MQTSQHSSNIKKHGCPCFLYFHPEKGLSCFLTRFSLPRIFLMRFFMCFLLGFLVGFFMSYFFMGFFRSRFLMRFLLSWFFMGFGFFSLGNRFFGSSLGSSRFFLGSCFFLRFSFFLRFGGCFFLS